jgi:hypothetical protein
MTLPVGSRDTILSLKIQLEDKNMITTCEELRKIIKVIIHVYTVKPAYVVNPIKQLPVLKGYLLRSWHRKFNMNRNLFYEFTCLIRPLIPGPKVTF